MLAALLALTGCIEKVTLLSQPDAAIVGDDPDAGTGLDLAPGTFTAGTSHACVIRGGTVHCWGANAAGQLGVGDTRDRATPTALLPGGGWLAVSGGNTHSCALRSGGTVWCWGGNDRGQLGTGSRTSELFATQVALASPARAVATRFNHTCAVLTEGTLWCWGENSEGQLGLGLAAGTEDRTSPMKVGADSDWVAVSPGQGHTCALKGDDSLWCWGRNGSSELGQDVGAPANVFAPVRVRGPTTAWSSVSSGQSSTCAIAKDGSAACWGQKLNDAASKSDLPAALGGTGWQGLEINTFAGCGVASGTLWCFGRNTEAQLGTGDRLDRSAPVQVNAEAGWLDVAAGRFFHCARRRDATVWCAGQNDRGELGLGHTMSVDRFTRQP